MAQGALLSCGAVVVWALALYVFSRARTSLLGRLGGASAAATEQARLRDFGLGAQVLAHLGARTIRLLTNRPRPIVGLGGYGLEVVECVPIQPPARVVALHDAAVTSGKGTSS